MTPSRQQILVAGGAGFNGHNLVRALLERDPNIQITVVDNDIHFTATTLPTESNRLIWRRCDIRQREALTAVFDQTRPDVVINLAAHAGVADSIADPQANFEADVIGHFNLLDLARTYGAGHFVFASTGGRPFDKNKPLIIFVHGSGLTHMTWVLQTRYFAFHGYSVLAIDMPGHGLSGGESLKSIEDMADWISKVIDVVGYKEASLVGHSQGCLVTVECTARYPDKIKTLSLIGGAGAIPMNPELLSLAENNDQKAVDLMMDWAHGPAGHFGGHPVPGLYHINTGTMLAKTRSIKNTLGIDFRACDNYKNGFEAAKKIKIPTLSILATDDKMCPVKEGKKLADLIEGSQVEIIDNCGHMMLLEEADRVLAVLKKFITSKYPPKEIKND